jgi:hypothetical protein
MANYAVTDYVSAVGTLAAVMALVETYLETLADTKTIRMEGVIKHGNSTFQAYLIHDA